MCLSTEVPRLRLHAAEADGGLVVVGLSGLATGLVDALATLVRAGGFPRGVFFVSDEDQISQDAVSLLRDAAGERFYPLNARKMAATNRDSAHQMAQSAPSGMDQPYEQ